MAFVALSRDNGYVGTPFDDAGRDQVEMTLASTNPAARAALPFGLFASVSKTSICSSSCSIEYAFVPLPATAEVYVPLYPGRL
jgi:hypothetical protein